MTVAGRGNRLVAAEHHGGLGRDERVEGGGLVFQTGHADRLTEAQTALPNEVVAAVRDAES